MADLFTRIVDKWLSYSSIPVVVILMGLLYEPILNNINCEDEKCNMPVVVGAAMLFLVLVYAFACYMKNRLPKAHKDSLAVLFSIDTEDDKTYKSVCRKLVENFQHIINQPNGTPFEVICVAQKRVKKYPMNKPDKLSELLKRINCTLYISVRYEVDDITSAENFEMRIDYGILHPRLNNEAERMLSYDMKALGKVVKKRKFCKGQLLDEFNVTAQTLSYICRYITGISCLLANSPAEACELLSELNTQLASGEHDLSAISNFPQLVQNRLFTALILLTRENIRLFENSYDVLYLKQAKVQLYKANKIYPDTYHYNVGMAYIAVALEHDGNSAKIYVDKSKQQNEDETWRYSEAFLSAYLGMPPMVICARYREALCRCEYNHINLIGYIEYMLETESEKIMLHLAVGLLYEYIGDPIQMKRHFSLFLMQYPVHDKRVEKLLGEKIRRLPCDIECNHKCDACSPEE